MIINKRKKHYFDQYGVTAKEFKLLHGVGVKSDDGIVIVDGLINDEPIRRLLPLQNGGAEVSLRSLTETK